MEAMDLFSEVKALVLDGIAQLVEAGDLPEKLGLGAVTVEPPRDPAHGDMATNAAMVLARPAKKKPRDIAEALAAKLEGAPGIALAEVAGPGFINLRLEPGRWFAVIPAVLQGGRDFGRSAMGGSEKVNVEFVSANPTGPMHVGHTRGAVFGDALASLLQFAGYDVTREYYINDGGAQVDVLARSAFHRYREALGEDVGPVPEGMYPGDYLVPVGQTLAKEYGPVLERGGETEWLPIVRDKAVAMMMAEIRDDLAALNVRHDVFFSERSLAAGNHSPIAATIEELEARGLVYRGRLPPPKGQLPDDWEDREQLLFRSTAYGDDIDRPLVKSDGSYTYFASDIAYHASKFERDFREMIDVWGADHGGYIKRMQAAVQAVSQGKAELDVKIVQLVRLLRAGEPVKMSKRAGDFVTLREVVDEVGRDAVRFMMLYRKNDATLDFDLAKVIEQSRDNPVLYVQYGHARGQSLFRNAREAVPDLPVDPVSRASFLLKAPLERLDTPGEIDLLKRIAQYPRVIEAAALSHEPHRVAFYLYDLASALHTHWTHGNQMPHLRFIILDDPTITVARLALIQGVVSVLASGLRILGVEAPEEMR
jgi:arginyl-tRNA synthetase